MYLYHGTHKERGNRIIEANKMEYSQGDDQWLGNGIYLYKDKLLAFRWINIKYKQRYKAKDIKTELFNNYMILKVGIIYDYDRVFSFSNPEHKIEFDKIKENCLSKVEKFKQLGTNDIVDGAIINFMFNEMGYGEDFDIVEAFFILENDEKGMNSRLKSFGELQLCVKNENNIISIEDVSQEFDFNLFDGSLQTFNKYRTNFKDKSNSYSKKRRGGNYGKKSFRKNESNR